MVFPCSPQSYTDSRTAGSPHASRRFGPLLVTEHNFLSRRLALIRSPISMVTVVASSRHRLHTHFSFTYRQSTSFSCDSRHSLLLYRVSMTSDESGRSEDTSPVFPTELICKVIDYHGLHDNPRRGSAVYHNTTLFSCALVNRASSYHARSIIFRSVILSHTDRVQALERLLRADPVLGSFVKTFVFQLSADQGAIFLPHRHTCSGVVEMFPWDCFSTLHTLRFIAVRIPSVASIRDILDRIPTLECLQFSAAQFSDYNPSHHVNPSTSGFPGPSEPQLPASAGEQPVGKLFRYRYPNLKSLIVLYTNIDPGACAQLFLGCPSFGPNTAHLETLILHSLTNLPRAEDYFGWTPLICASHDTLRKIELKVFSTPPGVSLSLSRENEGTRSQEIFRSTHPNTNRALCADTGTYPARLFSALAGCSMLRSIELECCCYGHRSKYRTVEDQAVPADTEKGLKEVFDALCTHLALSPHPQLEELKLIKYEGGSEPFPAAACARLADALLGPRRKPGDLERARPCPLRQLTLVVRVDNPPAGPRIAIERGRAKPVVERKWKEAFGRFEEEGVELVVDALF